MKVSLRAGGGASRKALSRNVIEECEKEYRNTAMVFLQA